MIKVRGIQPTKRQISHWLKQGRNPDDGSPTHRKSATPSKRERQFKHVYESGVDRGLSHKAAEALAARVTNKQRAKDARVGKGPKLVTRGGSRRQWFPGKAKALGKREKFVCLKHRRKFKTKAGMRSHFRGRLHGRHAA